jgi:hypothetical protein
MRPLPCGCVDWPVDSDVGEDADGLTAGLTARVGIRYTASRTGGDTRCPAIGRAGRRVRRKGLARRGRTDR